MNKPVAWIRDGDDQLSLVRQKDDGYMVWKPLYTHPVKELDEDFDAICLENKRLQAEIDNWKLEYEKLLFTYHNLLRK